MLSDDGSAFQKQRPHETKWPENAVPRGVVVVGGGTAGYLAALTLRAFHPDLEITLIDSTKTPIIGVGEATTSEIVPFLHKVLQLDPAEFYREVRPTWKLGIKFLWGPADAPFFNYPFDRGPLLEGRMYEGHTNNATLNSALMTKDLSPLFSLDHSRASLLPHVPFAYHLDNKRFVQYLRDKATARGVRRLDHDILDAVLGVDGETIDHLVTSDGVKLKYDFYIDCSGFRSLLMERALRSPFQSYASSLLTDAAVVANTPRRGPIKPYTTAETMDSGWCWNIPQVDEDHLGYVFASKYCSADQAIDELQRKFPEISDLRTLKFRSGRHEHFVKGNVAAIGNSYGFVEPLESTGIFVICRQCTLLACSWTGTGPLPSSRSRMNAAVADLWDYIRWFLAVHYRFNGRRSTPFWEECRSRTDVSGAMATLASYSNGAPLSYYGVQNGPGGGHNFDEFGYDVLLFGQALPANLLPARLSRKEYFAHVRRIERLTGMALEQDSALDIMMSDGQGSFDDLMAGDSWVQSLANTMLEFCAPRDTAELHPEPVKVRTNRRSLLPQDIFCLAASR